MSSLSLLFSVFSLFLPHLSPVYITHAAASTMAAELPPLLASVKTVGLLEPLHALMGNLFLAYASRCNSIAERRWPLFIFFP